MRHRSEHRIVYDMLKVLENRDSAAKLRYLYRRAKIGYQVQLKYTEILNDCGLAKITGVTLDDITLITSRGHEYLKAYRDLLRLMGERP